jgi:hypothetical protein
MATTRRVPLVARPGPVADVAAGKILIVHADAIRDLQQRPLLDGFLLDDIELDTTVKTLRHGLKRRAHYHVVRRSAAAHVYDDPADDRLNELWLRADAPVTVSLWIF